jgi:hypothetical protein
MADGYLEKQQREYEARKANYLRRKQHLPPLRKQTMEPPEDEAL